MPTKRSEPVHFALHLGLLLILWFVVGLALFALAVAIAANAHGADGAGAATPSGGNSVALMQLVPWVLSALGGLFGLWRNKKLSTTQKVLNSVVIGVEAAGRMPAVIGNDSAIKQQIRIRAEAAGVAPILHEIVKTIAEPTVRDEEDAAFEATKDAGADRP